MKDREAVSGNKSNLQIFVNVSGGKDSTALYLYALEQGVDFRAVFADTGHEHEMTIEYVNSLHKKTGGPVVETVRRDFPESQFEARRKIIRETWSEKYDIPQSKCEEICEKLQKTGNPFLDSCLIRGMFPSYRIRFCTEALKVIPLEEQKYQPVHSGGGSRGLARHSC